MKLRYWYKIDHNKQPIPGSNIRRKSRPGATHQWREILDPCCDPLVLDCTCGPKYFVQLDGRGKPVDHTLIKRVDQSRNNFPEGTTGLKLYELDWKSTCCVFLNWQFVAGGGGSLVINVNGNQVLNQLVDGTGSIRFNLGDTIEIILDPDPTFTGTLNISGGETFLSTGAAGVPVEYEFTWKGQEVNVFAQISS